MPNLVSNSLRKSYYTLVLIIRLGGFPPPSPHQSPISALRHDITYILETVIMDLENPVVHNSTTAIFITGKNVIREPMISTVGNKKINNPREQSDNQCSRNYSKYALCNKWFACKDMISNHKNIVKALRTSTMGKERAISKLGCNLRLQDLELENMGRVEIVSDRWKIN